MKKRLDDKKLSIKPPYYTYVWAEDAEGLIGAKGDLPWKMPAEMQHFVDVTIGDVVVMGRKSYESIPNPPLRDRVNIVLTRNEDYQADGAVICHSKEDVLNYLKKKDFQDPIHIIGGTTLFEIFMDEVDVLYRTVVHEVFDGDTYMPQIDYGKFELVDQSEGEVDEDNPHAHTYYLYERRETNRSN